MPSRATGGGSPRYGPIVSPSYDRSRPSNRRPSSTRIEGAELSDMEVAKVLEGVEVDSFRSRDEAEVSGYGELLTLIFENHAEVFADREPSQTDARQSAAML